MWTSSAELANKSAEILERWDKVTTEEPSGGCVGFDISSDDMEDTQAASGIREEPAEPEEDQRRRKVLLGEINITQLFTKASNTNKD